MSGSWKKMERTNFSLNKLDSILRLTLYAEVFQVANLGCILGNYVKASQENRFLF